MKKIIFSFFIFFSICLSAQTINLNESHLIDYFRTSQLTGHLNSDFSFTQRPIHLGKNGLNINDSIFNLNEYSPTVLNFMKGKGFIKVLPIDFNIEYSSKHPYNRNNGSMIPTRGYQQLISAGLYAEIGVLSINLKPEYLFSENKIFDGFYDGHADVIWAKRYNLWNHADIPERFGQKSHNKTLIGQSSIKINYKGLSFGVSNENIWWGPSIRNGIMMSNHSTGFKHITFNTNRPIKTKVGNFEWQFVTGRLEPSGFTPPQTDRTYAGTLLYVPQGNQTGNYVDWRYFQGYSITYSPKWTPNLSIGLIRWVQFYRALLDGEYFWMEGNPGYFPVFSNLFRKNDKMSDIEDQIDQAAGLFFRWIWKDSKAEIYAEFHYNDAKLNIRDLLLDSDHARAATIGLQKIFNSKNEKNNYLFSWEWTQLEQTAGRLLRSAGSWYMHNYVQAGLTNKGEVLGAGIGPGSNSHFFSLSKIKKDSKMGISLEIIDQDNDFLYYAFENIADYRRYWKDYNLHLNFNKKLKNIWVSINLVYNRSLNYQWELEENATTYYQPGRDVDNFHANIKMIYQIPIK
ncbi:MAG: hypothetical protein HN595_00365 [Flavobacteriaceae bacterium]|jgi:hypothetical protein|nr:hypothetical protein [Flavobacteriaceae bacterium]